MIARCSDCSRAYLEIDSRKLGDSLPRCSACELERIGEAEAERTSEAGKALAVVASAPASWGSALLRKRGKYEGYL